MRRNCPWRLSSTSCLKSFWSWLSGSFFAPLHLLVEEWQAEMLPRDKVERDVEKECAKCVCCSLNTDGCVDGSRQRVFTLSPAQTQRVEYITCVERNGYLLPETTSCVERWRHPLFLPLEATNWSGQNRCQDWLRWAVLRDVYTRCCPWSPCFSCPVAFNQQQKQRQR